MNINQTIVLLFLISINSLFCMEGPSEGEQSSKRPRLSSVSEEGSGSSTSPAYPIEETLLSLLPAQESQPSDNQAEKSKQITRQAPSLYALIEEQVIQGREDYKSEFHTLPEEVQESLKRRTKVTFLKDSPNMNLIFGAKSLNEILDLITQGVDINAQSGEGDTPFNFFIKSRQLPLAHALIDTISTLDVWTPDRYYWIPLMHAIVYKDNALIIKIFDRLIKNGKIATIIRHNTNFETILHLAARYSNDVRIIFAFIKASDPNQTNAQCFTPLMLAAQHNPNPEIISALIKGGSNPNKATASKIVTPLMLSSAHNTLEIVKVLVENGADIVTRNAEGKTALDYAKQNPDQAVYQFLSSRLQK